MKTYILAQFLYFHNKNLFIIDYDKNQAVKILFSFKLITKLNKKYTRIAILLI